ncbi:putative component of NuA3 histone acetyltransferase complex [Linderina macrospora]|uniref:Component of NuA3 histone acetyltransferase complex n=1 Tax=Linderina macrospora TaxID=4868 RepID=A0ACC1J4Y6_9FUNG|nr:putative component of NuA3 histone acetyltransferase complex [Linderina macrospora]
MEQSSVELRDFLRPDVFETISKELSDAFWSEAPLMGPPNVRQYLAAKPTTPVVKDLARFLRSTKFASLLKSLTSLDVIKGSQELRRFSRGHYTLIHDQALEPTGLDVTLSLTQKTEWDDEEWGGATHYIADADELLRIQPATNSLALVLRDEGVLRFVKYLNHLAEQDRQEISMVFIEQPEE